MFLMRHAFVGGMIVGGAAALIGSAQAAEVNVPPPRAGFKSCVVHIRDGDRDITTTCGAPVTVHGVARAWIETENSVSPFLTDVSAGGSFRITKLLPKAVVHYEAAPAIQDGQQLRFISLASTHAAKGELLFVRDVAASSTPVVLPAGGFVSITMDQKMRPIAAAEPQFAAAGEHRMTMRHDATASPLIAFLGWPADVKGAEDEVVSAVAADAEGEHPPDAIACGSDLVFAMWSHMTGHAGYVAAQSHRFFVPRENVAFAPGRLSMVECSLRARPTLTIGIGTLPAGARAHKFSATITPAGEQGRAERRISVEPGYTYVVEELPVSLFDVDLSIDGAVVTQSADLSSGQSARVAFALDPILISGTVYKGAVPVPAEVRFLQKGAPLVFTTDPAGNYDATLWHPGRYIIEAAGEGDTGPPFSLDAAIAGSSRLDIRIPDNALKVHVFDAVSHDPVPDAKIAIHNKWIGGSSAGIITVAGAVTALPPQRPGTVEIRVSAPGYVSAAPVRFLLTDSAEDRSIDVALSREAGGVDLTVSLSDHSPAAGAELAAFTNGFPRWRGTAGDDGHVMVPATVARDPLIVRHAAAGSIFTVLGSPSTNAVDLLPPAPPLVIQIVDAAGHPVREPLHITYWLAGSVRLTGDEVAFATWSSGMTAPDGSFVAKGVAAAPCRVLATRQPAVATTGHATYDDRAVVIAYPWSGVVRVTIANE